MKPDIRVTAFGEVEPTDRRPFVMGDFYSADQMRETLALAAAWKDLFWQVSLALKCLPSSFVDGNEHVLNKARELEAARPT